MMVLVHVLACGERQPMRLGRIPIAGELVLDAFGRNLIVASVRHLSGAEVTAEVRCNVLETTEQKTE